MVGCTSLSLQGRGVPNYCEIFLLFGLDKSYEISCLFCVHFPLTILLLFKCVKGIELKKKFKFDLTKHMKLLTLQVDIKVECL